jgi:hypothetical protein
MGAQQARWEVALTGPHYTVTCPTDGSVRCTPALTPGLWEVMPFGDDIYAKAMPGETTELPITDGKECRKMRDGGGGFVRCGDRRVVAVYKTGLVFQRIQRLLQ